MKADLTIKILLKMLIKIEDMDKIKDKDKDLKMKIIRYKRTIKI